MEDTVQDTVQDTVTEKLNYNIACCMCIRNCGPYLKNVFNNLDSIRPLFTTIHMIFVHDHCTDDSVKQLLQYQKAHSLVTIIDNNAINKDVALRTVRIANARNRYLDVIYNEIKTIDYHIIIDADDVNNTRWDTDLIKKHMNNHDKWDAISFNRAFYYDTWALLYGSHKVPHRGYDQPFPRRNRLNGTVLNNHIIKDISKRLQNMSADEYFPCYSAFNGFAIYKTKIFQNIHYDGTAKLFHRLIDKKERLRSLKYIQDQMKDSIGPTGIKLKDEEPEACEHLSYHLLATKHNNARIRITKDNLFVDKKYNQIKIGREKRQKERRAQQIQRYRQAVQERNAMIQRNSMNKMKWGSMDIYGRQHRSNIPSNKELSIPLNKALPIPVKKTISAKPEAPKAPKAPKATNIIIPKPTNSLKMAIVTKRQHDIYPTL